MGLSELVDDMTLFVVSESRAFPDVHQLRALPLAQKLAVDRKMVATKRRIEPLIRAMARKILLRKNVTRPEFEKLASVLDSSRVVLDGENFSPREMKELVKEGIEDSADLGAELAQAARDNNNLQLISGGKKRKRKTVRRRRKGRGKTRGKARKVR